MGKLLTKPATRQRKSKRQAPMHEMVSLSKTRRRKSPTLAELKRDLMADPTKLLKFAEASTLKLTGRKSI